MIDVRDEAPRARLTLLGAIWPTLPAAIECAAGAGADWFAMSTAFERMLDGRTVAHAGVLRIPMVIDGIARDVAGIHAVCTAPGVRGRGLGRQVIEAAIDHALDFADTVVLHAVDAAVYARFGMRAVDQWVWWTDIDDRRRAAPMRRLDADVAGDVALVHTAFRGRLPVADSLGVGEAAALFVLDEIIGCGDFARLLALDDGTVVAADLDERVLQIYDIVGPTWPPLADIVARAPGRVDRVEVFFDPQRWTEVRWRLREARPVDVLMVRGPFTTRPIAIPPLARC